MNETKLKKRILECKEYLEHLDTLGTALSALPHPTKTSACVGRILQDLYTTTQRERHVLLTLAEKLRYEEEAIELNRVADAALRRLEEQGEVRLNEEGKWYWAACGELL